MAPTTDNKPFRFMDQVPAEIRLQIYEEYLSEARILEPNFDIFAKEFKYPTFHVGSPREPLLSTCHETRHAAFQHGCFLFGNQGRPGVYFRKADVMFLNLDALIKLTTLKIISTHHMDRKGMEVVDSMRLVENLAIEWGSIVSSYGLQAICPQLGAWFLNVKKVYLTIPGVRYTTAASAAEPMFLKGEAAELHPIAAACVLPKHTKSEEDEHTEGETWDTGKQDLIDKVFAVFELHERHDIDVQAYFLHRARLPKCPLKKDLLVYDTGALGQKQITAGTFNSTVVRF